MYMPQVRKKAATQKTFLWVIRVGFRSFSKVPCKNSAGDFNAKLGKRDIFKPTIGNESLHQDSNDKGVRIVNFAISKNAVIKSMTFLHRCIHKYTWTSPDGKTDNQIDHILIGEGIRVYSIYDLWGKLTVTDHYLVIAKVRGSLALSKQAAQKFDVEIFNLNNVRLEASKHFRNKRRNIWKLKLMTLN